MHFLAIYDDWGYRKLKLLQDNGFNVEILWTRPLAEKGITASEVRKLIRENQPWEHLLSGSGANAIKLLGLEEKIKT